MSIELLTSASADLADYTILGQLAVRFTSKWTKNEIVESGGGHVPHCPIAGDATDAYAEFIKSLTKWLNKLY